MKELFDLNSNFFQGDKSVRVMRSLLAAQQTFVDKLVQLMKAVQRESGNRKKKVIVEKKKSTSAPWITEFGRVLYHFFALFSLCLRAGRAFAGSAGRQREGEPFRDRTDSSSSGTSDQDQRHRP